MKYRTAKMDIPTVKLIKKSKAMSRCNKSKGIMTLWQGKMPGIRSPCDMEYSYKIQPIDKTLPRISGTNTAVEFHEYVPPPQVSARLSSPKPQRNSIWPP
jgi:hypothetical protein